MNEQSTVSLTEVTAKDRFEYMLDTIRERIIRLEYPPGTRIGEVELAQEFGVSRTPVRRVLSRLEYEEFVEIRQGSGTYITDIVWDDLFDAYELRMRQAELIGDLSPRCLSSDSLEKIYQIRTRIKELGTAMTAFEYRELNSLFQAEINKCIGNRQLQKSITRLYLLTQRHWLAWQPAMDWDVEIDAFQSQLEDTIRCLEINDLRGVGLVWRNVISGMRRRLEEIWCRNGKPQNLTSISIKDSVDLQA